MVNFAKDKQSEVTTVDNPMYLPCGGVAYFDWTSRTSYICHTCFCVVGSVGQPRECDEAVTKYQNWVILGGEQWDYTKPVPGLHDTEVDE